MRSSLLLGEKRKHLKTARRKTFKKRYNTFKTNVKKKVSLGTKGQTKRYKSKRKKNQINKKIT